MESPAQTRPHRKDEGLGEILPWSYPVLGFAAVSVLLVAYLCQFGQIIRAEYALVSLSQQHKCLQREQADLELKVQELTSLERIQKIAVGRLGMVAPKHRQVLQLSYPAGAVCAGRALGRSRMIARAAR